MVLLSPGPASEHEFLSFLRGLIRCVGDLCDVVGQLEVGERLAVKRHALHEVLKLAHISADDLIAHEGFVPAELSGKHLADVHVVQAVFVKEIGVQQVGGGDVAVQRRVVGVDFDIVLRAAEDGVAGYAQRLGAVAEGEAQDAVILNILRPCGDVVCARLP